MLSDLTESLSAGSMVFVIYWPGVQLREALKDVLQSHVQQAELVVYELLSCLGKHREQLCSRD